MPGLAVGDVVARLEEIAAIDLPEDTTDVTDRVDTVEADVAAALAADPSLRRGLLDALATHPDAKVQTWLDALVTPSAWLTVAEPERLYAQPGVPITAEKTPTLAALTLGARTEEHLGFLERRRARSMPWRTASAWLFGDPQASTALDTWPTVDGAPLPFWLQLDLAEAENNVAPYEFSRTGLPNTGVLQFYADTTPAASGGAEPQLVAHRVAYLPADTLLDQAAARPSRHKPLAPSRPVGTDTMATLPHEDDAAPAYAWDDGDRFDYRVLKQVLEADPYQRNPQVPSPADDRSPVVPDYRPVVPAPRLGGHLLPSRHRLAPALGASGPAIDDLYPLLDLPLEGLSPDPTGDPDRVRLLVMATREDVATRMFTDTVAVRYYGPGQPLPGSSQPPAVR